jgi:hypothetical protein
MEWPLHFLKTKLMSCSNYFRCSLKSLYHVAVTRHSCTNSCTYIPVPDMHSRMHACTHAHTHRHIHTHTHTYSHTRIHTHKRSLTHAYTCTHTLTHTVDTKMHILVHVYVGNKQTVTYSTWKPAMKRKLDWECVDGAQSRLVASWV